LSIALRPVHFSYSSGRGGRGRLAAARAVAERGSSVRLIDRHAITYARVRWHGRMPGVGSLELVRAAPFGPLARSQRIVFHAIEAPDRALARSQADLRSRRDALWARAAPRVCDPRRAGSARARRQRRADGADARALGDSGALTGLTPARDAVPPILYELRDTERLRDVLLAPRDSRPSLPDAA
jgi:hypothetical protein